MTRAILNITSLKSALEQLVSSHRMVLRARSGEAPREYYPFFRAATIQSYEYSYELSIKMMQRYIEMYGAAAAGETSRFTDLLRIAAEYLLIGDPLAWEEYRKGRNKTSHTYDEGVAEQVLVVVPSFIDSATTLVKRLEALIDAPHT